MIDIVLRVAAPDFDVEKFLERFPRLLPDASWRKGEQGLRSRPPSENAGFNKAIGEGESWAVAWKRTQESLNLLSEVLDTLAKSGVSRCIDVGILYDVQGPVVRQFSISPPELKYIASLGLELTVSFYPVDEGE